MKANVRKKLFSYRRRLKKVKDSGVQRVTSALESGVINVCLLKLPIERDEWMLVTEGNIKCPLCGRSKAVLTGPAHYWHSTEINCHHCGLHVEEWNANRLSIEEVKKQWSEIKNLRLKDIVPFGMSWHKKED